MLAKRFPYAWYQQRYFLCKAEQFSRRRTRRGVNRTQNQEWSCCDRSRVARGRSPPTAGTLTPSTGSRRRLCILF